ncbi:PEBP family protein [Planctopirus limnophila DSM 3776]|uniref:PEBP family protein n=1 Tax=Planctopirus limnophila (strain ATCC 43296 / DSM 3776 / IFAM 1008 / Mu 290) TaxID=521674 RepID=D5SYI2_PLAL2|nr:YHYH protein [Planctopirus limnophila]ADG67710.1 PEBP family protein [Planctopirus limnophila DSM 3776]
MHVPIRAGLLILAIGFTTSIVQAHPGHSHRKRSSPADNQASVTSERIWTSSTGAFREQGSFVMARDGLVQIRRDDDSLVSIPIALLRSDDQNWIERGMSEIQRLAETNGLVRANSEGNLRLDIPMRLPQPNEAVGFFPLVTNEFPLQQGVRRNVDLPAELLLAQLGNRKPEKIVAREQVPEIAKAFETFVNLKAIQTRWDDRFFYVESNGTPDHQMMVGITAWQQQVPLPQRYVGENAWQIPLHPIPAETPATAKNRFLRGAIAVAVNGIPIFNPLNNRGDDAYLFGELDEFGGHCGRADDYHYHIAPVHLEKTNGKGKPIAYALDGYPIYGYEEPDGSPVKNLDALNGHKDAKGNYHYHATKKYPYLNGGFYGVVTERDGQVDPQPRAEPLRPALPPLRDAKITGFQKTKSGGYTLTYDVRGSKGTISYTLSNDGSAKFVFVDTNGKTTEETYSPRQRGPGGGERRPPPQPRDNPPPRVGQRPPRDEGLPPPRNVEGSPANQAASPINAQLPQLKVTSSSIDANGFISVECTCDGKRESPAVAWKDAPEGTKSLAVSLWHTAPDQEKSYWVVYNIPVTTQSLAQKSPKAGTVGANDRRRAEYDPMCSKGPGVKTYHVTVYALSAKLNLPPEKASRAELLAAIKDITLATGTLDFKYERKDAR